MISHHRSKVLGPVGQRGRMRLKCRGVKTLVHACCMLRRESAKLAGSGLCSGPLRLLSILVPACEESGKCGTWD